MDLDLNVVGVPKLAPVTAIVFLLTIHSFVIICNQLGAEKLVSKTQKFLTILILLRDLVLIRGLPGGLLQLLRVQLVAFLAASPGPQVGEGEDLALGRILVPQLRGDGSRPGDVDGLCPSGPCDRGKELEPRRSHGWRGMTSSSPRTVTSSLDLIFGI